VGIRPSEGVPLKKKGFLEGGASRTGIGAETKGEVCGSRPLRTQERPEEESGKSSEEIRADKADLESSGRKGTFMRD